MIKAVLFDIGGTLLNAYNPKGWAEAYASTLERRLAAYGIEIDTPPAELAASLHRNAEDYKHYSEVTRLELPEVRIWNEFYLKEYAIGEEKLAPIAEQLSFGYDYERLHNVKKPDVKEALEALHGMGLRLGIISNNISRSFVPHVLVEYGIEHLMDLVMISSQEGVRKPDPEIFYRACGRLGITPEELGYVGDTISRDVLGSRNAGLGLVVQISNPSISHRDAAFLGKPDCPKPDFLIEELSELPGILKQVNSMNN